MFKVLCLREAWSGRGAARGEIVVGHWRSWAQVGDEDVVRKGE